MQLRPTYPIRTERLELRALHTADADDLSYLADPDVVRYVPFDPLDRDEVAARIAERWSNEVIEHDGQHLTFAVVPRAGGRVLGRVVCMYHSELHRSGEVGWEQNPRFGGRGYATEAAHAALHVLFDDLALHRVVARVDTRNTRSVALAERLGMRREAHLVENEWFKGGWSDEYVFAMLEAEFRGLEADGCSFGFERRS